MSIIMIAAIGENNEIVANGDMPWTLPSDLRMFQRATSGHTIVMGRKTLDSIGN